MTIASLVISSVSATGFLLAGLAAWGQRKQVQALTARLDDHEENHP